MTKERILDAAQDLIQRRSFHGFSFQDLADRVGIRKPSLYHHFDSKEALALAVLERAADWVRTQVAKADDEDPAARLECYFEMFRDIHGKGERVCPGGSFAAVFDGVSSSVQSGLHRFTRLHLDLLESIVREGAERGQFHIKDQRPRDVAMQIFAGAQGALMIGRLTGDAHAIDAVIAEFRNYLGYVPHQVTTTNSIGDVRSSSMCAQRA
ncbi:MAG: TetR/AcrR family transcriptional regulator [Methyloceanibacter sp.]|uniref:TetR/AcrR family transcriptional regulator n=1 Tax=Methyloceanibacter sp. TaxID=1965321 RepID=UPI003D6D2BCA